MERPHDRGEVLSVSQRGRDVRCASSTASAGSVGHPERSEGDACWSGIDASRARKSFASLRMTRLVSNGHRNGHQTAQKRESENPASVVRVAGFGVFASRIPDRTVGPSGMTPSGRGDLNPGPPAPEVRSRTSAHVCGRARLCVDVRGVRSCAPYRHRRYPSRRLVLDARLTGPYDRSGEPLAGGMP